MIRMKVTIKKIAEVAGVSRGTVDRALNGRTGVNKEVAERICKIAEDLGYQPDLAAKLLASKKNPSLKMGILLNSEDNPFYTEILRGRDDAIAEAESFGMKCICKTIKGYDVDLQLQKIQELVQEGINGLVLTPINSREITNIIRELNNRNIPTVTINTDAEASERLTYVGCEYIQSGKVGAGLLGMVNGAKQGRIGIIAGSRWVMAQDRRIVGFMDTILEDFPNIKVKAIIENQDNDEISYELTRDILLKNPELTGVCFVAAGVEGGLCAIKDLGKEHDLDIITYDLTDVVRENLLNNVIAATVCQEPYKQGYYGVEILRKYLLTGAKPENDTMYTENFIVTKYNL